LSISPASPIITLFVGAVLAYFFGCMRPQSKFTGLFYLLFLVISLVELLKLYPEGGGASYSLWWGMLTSLEANGLAVFLGVVAVGLGILVLIYDVSHMGDSPGLPRYYSLILIMLSGAIGIGFAGDLFNLFVFFEVMAIPSYVLVAFRKERWEPVEAAVKYAIMSISGSLLALGGISIIFMYTGNLNLDTFVQSTGAMPPRMTMVAVALIIVGFGVKVGMVPLHMWLPDAYQAAPSGISGLLSGITSGAGAIAMLKALAVLVPSGTHPGVVLIIFGVISMFAGNFMALVQNDLKRMLAYSSIAHMGYVVMAMGLALNYLPLAGEYAFRGASFHILNHAVMKGGAFLCAGAIFQSIGTHHLHEMRGIGRKDVLVGVAFAFFAFALAGVPPLNGFISKFFICKAGADAGGWGIVAMLMLILNSAISLGYYLPAMNTILFSRDISEMAEKPRPLSAWIGIPIIVMMILTVLLGVYPEAGLKIVNPAVQYLMGFAGGL
jgi:proton-translocating NADH-quinone oxidoreductase chain N